VEKVPVKNVGTVLVGLSLTHIGLPVAASVQDRIPVAPKVTIFPSATAGVLLGPG